MSMYNMVDTYFCRPDRDQRHRRGRHRIPHDDHPPGGGHDHRHGRGQYDFTSAGPKTTRTGRAVFIDRVCNVTAGRRRADRGRLLFPNAILRLLGATESILPYARDYARYIFIGAPLFAGSFVLNNAFARRGQRHPFPGRHCQRRCDQHCAGPAVYFHIRSRNRRRCNRDGDQPGDRVLHSGFPLRDRPGGPAHPAGICFIPAAYRRRDPADRVPVAGAPGHGERRDGHPQQSRGRLLRRGHRRDDHRQPCRHAGVFHDLSDSGKGSSRWSGTTSARAGWTG